MKVELPDQKRSDRSRSERPHQDIFRCGRNQFWVMVDKELVTSFKAKDISDTTLKLQYVERPSLMLFIFATAFIYHCYCRALVIACDGVGVVKSTLSVLRAGTTFTVFVISRLSRD